MFKRKLPTVTGGKIDNHIGANTRFNGTLTSDGNIRIDGIFQGHIETSGNVIVGPTAKVLAEVTAHSVQVWGAVRGNVTARGRLEILPEGRVWGDVEVASLLVDDGGLFRGQCKMLGQDAEPLMLPDVTLPVMTRPAELPAGGPPPDEQAEEPAGASDGGAAEDTGDQQSQGAKLDA